MGSGADPASFGGLATEANPTPKLRRLLVADEKRVSMEEIEAQGAVSLPNKEVLSLLDVNANVDLGLDLAAHPWIWLRPPI
jgi:hypothetical protein